MHRAISSSCAHVPSFLHTQLKRSKNERAMFQEENIFCTIYLLRRFHLIARHIVRRTRDINCMIWHIYCRVRVQPYLPCCGLFYLLPQKFVLFLCLAYGHPIDSLMIRLKFNNTNNKLGESLMFTLCYSSFLGLTPLKKTSPTAALTFFVGLNS